MYHLGIPSDFGDHVGAMPDWNAFVLPEKIKHKEMHMESVEPR